MTVRKARPCKCGAETLTRAHGKGRGHARFVRYTRRDVAEVHDLDICRIMRRVTPRPKKREGLSVLDVLPYFVVTVMIP